MTVGHLSKRGDDNEPFGSPAEVQHYFLVWKVEPILGFFVYKKARGPIYLAIHKLL